MKIYYFSRILILIFFIPGLHSLYAQKQQDKALQSIIRDVYVLANDSLQGRQSGLPSVEKSIKYIENRYKEIGLTTYPKLNSYRQSFHFFTDILAKNAWVKSDNMELEHRRHFYTTRYTADTSIQATIQFIPDQKLYEALLEKNELQIQGKIALINITAKPKKNTPYHDSVYNYKLHIKYLIDQNVAGIILMGQKVWYSDLVGKFAHIKTNIPVFYTFPNHHDLVMAFDGKKVNMGAELPEKQLGENILGFIDNNAPKTIVIGAHYDHLGIGYFGRNEEYKDSVYNGADDNASGVAGILELAAMLKAKKSSQHNYLFIALGAEERGLKGSRAFVNSKLFDKNEILIYFNYDMIGRMRKMRDKLFLIGSSTAKELPKLIKSNKYKEGKLKNIKKTSTGSDHTPFYKKNIPILYFTTGLHRDYHTHNDDTKYLNFEGLKYTVDYTYKIINALDDYQDLNFTPAKYMSLINWIPMYLP